MEVCGFYPIKTTMPENYSKRDFIIQQHLFENVHPMTQASYKTWMMSWPLHGRRVFQLQSCEDFQALSRNHFA